MMDLGVRIVLRAIWALSENTPPKFHCPAVLSPALSQQTAFLLTFIKPDWGYCLKVGPTTITKFDKFKAIAFRVVEPVPKPRPKFLPHLPHFNPPKLRGQRGSRHDQPLK